VFIGAAFVSAQPNGSGGVGSGGGQNEKTRFGIWSEPRTGAVENKNGHRRSGNGLAVDNLVRTTAAAVQKSGRFGWAYAMTEPRANHDWRKSLLEQHEQELAEITLQMETADNAFLKTLELKAVKLRQDITVLRHQISSPSSK